MYTDKERILLGGRGMKRAYAVDANRCFLLSIIMSQVLLLVVVGLGVKDQIVLQFLVEVFMVLPCWAYLWIQKKSIRECVTFEPFGWKVGVLLLPLAFCVDKVAEFINVLSQLFVPNEIGSYMVAFVQEYPFPVAFFVIAVTPAVCEELIYRGILYSGYRKSGKWLAIILTAFLFGIMHMNLNQFSYAFALGILFALINEMTGSMLPSMLLHLYVNGRSVVVLYVMVNFLGGLREQYVAAELAGDTEKMENLLASAQGVPIDNAQWLQEYMEMGSGEVPETLLMLLPMFLIAVCGTAAILYVLWRRKCEAEKPENTESMAVKEAFLEGVPADTDAKKKWYGFISPTLIIGVALCILGMFVTK